MNAMPPDPAIRGADLARGLARPTGGDAAVALRMAAPAARRAVLASGLARARIRRHRGGDPQRRRLDGFRTWTRRSGCRPPARRHRGRSSGNWVHGLPVVGDPGPERGRTPRDGPLLRSMAEGAAERRGRRSRRSSGSSANMPSPSRSRRSLPGRWRAAAAYPASLGRSRAWSFAGGAVPLVGRLVDGHRRRGARRGWRGERCSGAAARRDRSILATARRSGRGPRFHGGPAGRPTAWAATCARTRASARPTPPSRSSRRSRSSAYRRSCSTWRFRRL